MKLQTLTITAFLWGLCAPALAKNFRGTQLRTLGGDLQRLTDEEYTAARTDLELRYPWAFEEQSASTFGIISNVAKSLGQEVFSNTVGLGFDTFIGKIFHDPLDDISNQLDEILNAIEDVQAVLGDIKDAIDKLQETADQIAFMDKENHAIAYATDIKSYFKLIDGWETGSYLYDDEDIRDLAKTSWKAIEQLDAYLRKPAPGTYQLLQTLVQHYDQQEALRKLDKYRIGYRAILATGMLNLEWAAEENSKYGNELDVAGETAHNLVEYLFDWSSLDAYTSELMTHYIMRHLPTWVHDNSVDTSFLIQSDGSEIQLDWVVTESSWTVVQNDNNFWSIELQSRPPTGQITNGLLVYFMFGTIEIDVFEGTIVSGKSDTSVSIGNELYNPVPMAGIVDLYTTRMMFLDLNFENVQQGNGDFVGSSVVMRMK